jgi:hypothetical protein
MSPVDVPPCGGLLAHRGCYRLAARAEGLAAPAEIQNNSGLSQAFVYSFAVNSPLSGGVHFVLAQQGFIIPLRSGRFAEWRQFCCDSVATDGTKEG